MPGFIVCAFLLPLLLLPPAPLPAGLFARIAPLLAGLQAGPFASLHGRPVVLLTLRSRCDSFMAWPAGLAWPPGRRPLVLLANERLLAGIPDDALQAALAHELAHFESYERRSSPRLLGLVLRYAASPRGRFARDYERETDAAAVGAGFGPGLAAFKRWQERALPPDCLAVKRRMYLSVEEVGALENALR